MCCFFFFKCGPFLKSLLNFFYNSASVSCLAFLATMYVES